MIKPIEANPIDKSGNLGLKSNNLDIAEGFRGTPTQLLGVLEPYIMAFQPKQNMHSYTYEPSKRNPELHTYLFPEYYSMNTIPMVVASEGQARVPEALAETYMTLPIHNHSESKTIETTFNELAMAWKLETRFLSSFTEIVLNKSYQEIIGLGPTVIPFILKRLQESPDQWFWALSVLTRDNPVPQEHAGNLTQMTDDWITWGREKGYL